MAVQVPQGFIVRSPEAIDDRLVLKKSEMLEFSRNENLGKLPYAYFCVCPEEEPGGVYRLYIYNRNNEYIKDTAHGYFGRFRSFKVVYGDLAGKPIAGGGIKPNLLDDPDHPIIELAIGDNMEFDSEGNLVLSEEFLNQIKDLNDRLAAEVARAISSEGRLQAEIDAKQDHLIAKEAIEIDQIAPGEADIYVKYDGYSLADEGTIILSGSNELEVNRGVVAFQEDLAILSSELDDFKEEVNSELDDLKDYVDSEILDLRNYTDSELAKKQNNIIAHAPLFLDSESNLSIKLDSEAFEVVNDKLGLRLDDSLKLTSDGISLDLDGRTIVIDANGKVALPINSEGLIILNSEGHLTLKYDKDTLKVDADGELAAKLGESLKVGSEGIEVDIDGRTLIIDSNGKVALPITSEGTVKLGADGKLTVNVDNSSVKIDSEGKLYATFRVEADERTLHVNSEGVISAILGKALEVTSEGIDVKPGDGSLEVTSEGLKVNKGKALEVTSEGLDVKPGDGSLEVTANGLRVKAGRTLETTSEGLNVDLDNIVDNRTIVVTSEGRFKVALNDLVDNDSVKLNSEGKLYVNSRVIVDSDTIIYDSSEDTIKVNFDRVQKKLVVDPGLRLTSEGIRDRLAVLYDGLLNDNSETLDIRNGHLYVKDVLYAGPTSSKGTLRQIIPSSAGTDRIAEPGVKNDLVTHDQLMDAISANLGAFRGTFASEAALEAAFPKGAADKNDYAFVTNVSSEGTFYDRYKCTDTAGNNWEFEFRIATSAFTADQWKALESMATKEDIQDFAAHIQDVVPQTAKTTPAEAYKLTHDTQGHITSSTLYNPDWVASVTNRTVTNPTTSDIVKTAPYVLQGSDSSKTGVIIASNTNTASGQNSIAGGLNATASSNRSIALGSGVTASGAAAFAIGYNSTATGGTAYAEGSSTLASGTVSHAEGYQTQAINEYAHAEGNGSIASGQVSHAEGRNTQATGNRSHAEGDYSQSIGNVSHAEGDHTFATGQGSHAEGHESASVGQYSHAEGGSIEDADNPGSYLYTVAAGARSHAEGGGNEADGDDSHVEGVHTLATEQAAHAEGMITIARGIASHAEGTDTTAEGTASHAEGAGSLASGDDSHAEGAYTQALGNYSHAEGGGLSETGSPVISYARGESSHAEGFGTIARGRGSHAEGVSTEIKNDNIDGAHVEGTQTIATASAQHVQGKYNIEDTEGLYADIVGWGSGTTRKNISSLTKTGDLHIKKDFYFQSDDDGKNGYKLPYNVITETGTGTQTLALAKRDHIYIYPGPITKLTVTAIEKTDAITDIIFTAGTSITVTLPTGVKLPSGFSGFEASKTYEINILYNLATVTTWD